MPEGFVPLGFSPQGYADEARWEEQYLALPDASRCGEYLRRLTARPHVAGTDGDRRVTRFIFDEFARDGLNPEIREYRVLLSYPKHIRVELVAPEKIQLARPEPEIPSDAATRLRDPVARLPWNGYSPSADLTAPVVYANYGAAADYEVLEKAGVSVKGKIVLARYFHGYRGGKSLEAEKRGAAGIVVYSDPAEDGAPRGPVYPDGPWGPLGHFQRGAVVYDFLTPGDPLTPGWASVPGARRIAASESKILPRIPMVPLSAADAAKILSRLQGATVPKDWQGGLPFPYHIGGGEARLRLKLEMENRVTPIWNVLGRIAGASEPEKLVALSNHHDAWVYGAVDPSSGTAAMLETARALGELTRRGFRPKRTIVLANWDAEEYTLTGSTEWGEEFEGELRKNGVICLNVDSATSGQDFTASLVPSLLRATMEAAQGVPDPATGGTVFDRWKERRAQENVRSYSVPGSAASAVQFGVLGGGSDFMVFLQHDGVPSLDLIFDGPYGVYHSAYDDYEWMRRIGDPGFRYHAAMARVWGLLAMRFAQADVLPFDYSLYAREVAAYLDELGKIAPEEFARGEIEPLVAKCRAWQAAAETAAGVLEAWRRGEAVAVPREELNAALMAEERAFLDDAGLAGRPWFRHLVYAPLPSYEAETLPGLREALEARDFDRAAREAKRLGRAIDRAISTLGVVSRTNH